MCFFSLSFNIVFGRLKLPSQIETKKYDFNNLDSQFYFTDYFEFEYPIDWIFQVGDYVYVVFILRSNL